MRLRGYQEVQIWAQRARFRGIFVAYAFAASVVGILL